VDVQYSPAFSEPIEPTQADAPVFTTILVNEAIQPTEQPDELMASEYYALDHVEVHSALPTTENFKPARNSAPETVVAVDNEAKSNAFKDSGIIDAVSKLNQLTESPTSPMEQNTPEIINSLDNIEESQIEVEASRNIQATPPIPTSSILIQSTQESSSSSDQQSQQDSTHEQTPELPIPILTPEQKRLVTVQSRNQALNATLADLTSQRTALLHTLAQHLSSHTLANIPSISQVPVSEPYHPSIPSHGTALLAPITPDDDDDKLMTETRKVIKDHIGRLHRYNEIRDVGQGLIGMIADQRGVRIIDCQEEFGVTSGD